MSIIKSFSAGEGDMFYIKHGSDNFTTIDCNYDNEKNRKRIFKEIKDASAGKGITRFISTHPDEDHIKGLKLFRSEIGISNFYCVQNEATKDDESEDFEEYCKLRDGDKAFYIFKGCSRKWMNESDDERGCSGLNCLWPETSNEDFLKELDRVMNAKSPNNISPIITCSLKEGVTAMWMGDMETTFMESIENDVAWPKINILFAPHHGRESGKVPDSILKKLDPDIIIIGEAPSKNINYYKGYNTITQNSAGDIIFECIKDKVRIYVSSDSYCIDFLSTEDYVGQYGNYIGTLNL
ncbi:MAG: hypothetical protein R3Y26_05125 [Rikenellaceae bacterium]